MKTLWTESDRNELVVRLGRLNPESKPLWGKMNCPQMLAHLADGFRMTLGDLEPKPRGGPLSFPPIRKLIIYWLPFPKSAPTAPELITRPTEGIERESKSVIELLHRIAESSDRTAWPDHPAFGKLSAQDWGVLGYRHMDHHLRQFGV